MLSRIVSLLAHLIVESDESVGALSGRVAATIAKKEPQSRPLIGARIVLPLLKKTNRIFKELVDMKVDISDTSGTHIYS